MIKYILFLVLFAPSLALADAGLSMDALITFQNSPWLAVIGLALIMLEFVLPTKGIMGLIGIWLFVMGTFSLADHKNPDISLSWPSVIIMNVLVVGTALFALLKTWRGYSNKNSAVTDSVINQSATVIDWQDNEGRVTLGGAVWQAKSAEIIALTKGDKVFVTAQDNLTVFISTTKGV